MSSTFRAILLCAASSAFFPAAKLTAQTIRGAAIGEFYSVEPPITAARAFSEVQIQRVAPAAVAMPPPIAPISLTVPVVALTGQIVELPSLGRLYVAALDASGSVALIRIDLLPRESALVEPPPGLSRPYAVQFLAAPDGSKLYVQWFAAASLTETDIYDGETLRWRARTTDFLPDERAGGFEHEPPYLWSLDRASRLVLVDTQSDRVVRVFDPVSALGPLRGTIADVWRDLVLLRLDAGHDRFRTVDLVTGELGPTLDLQGYRRAVARLVFGARLMALVDREPALVRASAGRLIAMATGSGTIFDLRFAREIDTFRLILAGQVSVAALGTRADPSVPGRLWLYAPGDQQRLDFDLPSCGRGVPGGDRVSARLESEWDPGEPLRYRYRLGVSEFSETAAGALAIRAGRASERARSPDGWGHDLIDRDRWIRWTNGLGPTDEDVSPGESLGEFVLEARSDTRPGIVEYRAQTAAGLARGCESAARFLKNSASGHTIGPEEVKTDNSRKLAQRLQKLVETACEIGWIDEVGCDALRPTARALVRESDMESVVHLFGESLTANRGRLRTELVAALHDATTAVAEAIAAEK